MEEPSAPIHAPVPRQATAPNPPMPRPQAPPASPPPRPSAPPAGGLLGGAYRENGADGYGAEPGPAERHPAPADNQQRSEQSLDAVFGRLAGRNRLPDPRDRLRHIPGLGPPAGRSR
jgi:hypothetical protein